MLILFCLSPAPCCILPLPVHCCLRVGPPSPIWNHPQKKKKRFIRLCAPNDKPPYMCILMAPASRYIFHSFPIEETEADKAFMHVLEGIVMAVVTEGMGMIEEVFVPYNSRSRARVFTSLTCCSCKTLACVWLGWVGLVGLGWVGLGWVALDCVALLMLFACRKGSASSNRAGFYCRLGECQC